MAGSVILAAANGCFINKHSIVLTLKKADVNFRSKSC